MNKDYIINTIKNNADAINSVKLNGEIFNILSYDINPGITNSISEI